MSQALNIDLTDPSVQHLLGGNPRLATVKRELVQIAGDVPHPDGHTAWRGAQSTTDLTGAKQEVVVVYRGMYLTVDLYVMGGETLAYLCCPRCHKVLTVRSSHKPIDFEPRADNPLRAEIVSTGDPSLVRLAGAGRLSIAPFECTWELENARHVPGALHSGTSLCRMKLAIDNNRAKDA
jgi:hypothetical protein